MKLTFLGATHEVTGSCYYLEAAGQRILIDCGMEQGPDYFENQPLPVKASDIDIVILTHAHMDHSGKIPLLVKEGFSGQIFCTEGTRELCSIMLLDSAHIQESEAQWKTRKAERAGRPPVEPMYTTEDAMASMRCFVGVSYRERRQIGEGIAVRFIDAGHLLGSASVELFLTEEGKERKLVFSGDIGNYDQPILTDPTPPESADIVVMESTYGDRLHERPADYVTALAQVLQQTFDRGGNVVIPSFAVGRTQEMLYFIRQIKADHLVRGHEDFEVYVDSPLAVEATSIFQKRMFYDFDEEASALLAQGINPIGFDGLKLSITSDESKQINFDQKSKVIISSSGMCEAGRIRHHLKHNLWRPECTILFVGYQAVGSLGRKLTDGAQSVKIFDEEISVQAEIKVLPGVSGHADQKGLIDWARAVKRSDDSREGERPVRFFVTHGDDVVCKKFAALLQEELGVAAYAPYSGTVYDLLADEILYEAGPIPIQNETSAQTGAAMESVRSEGGYTYVEESAARKAESRKEPSGERKEEEYVRRNRQSEAYQELLRCGSRLMQVITESAGYANGDLRKFAKELDKLAKKWER